MPVGEAVAVAGSIATVAKAIAEAISSARQKIGGSKKEAEQALSEIQTLVMTLQSSVLDLQTQILQLQEENGQLREQIRANESRATERQRYERKQVGESLVVVDPEHPEVYLCLHCFERGETGILRRGSGSHMRLLGASHLCSSCDAKYKL